jgi:hypothetical protein
MCLKHKTIMDFLISLQAGLLYRQETSDSNFCLMNINTGVVDTARSDCGMQGYEQGTSQYAIVKRYQQGIWHHTYYLRICRVLCLCFLQKVILLYAMIIPCDAIVTSGSEMTRDANRAIHRPLPDTLMYLFRVRELKIPVNL